MERNDKDTLIHYGVLGMKWGVRKSEKYASKSSKYLKKSKKFKKKADKAGLKSAKLSTKRQSSLTDVGKYVSRRRLQKKWNLDRKQNKFDYKAEKYKAKHEKFLNKMYKMQAKEALSNLKDIKKGKNIVSNYVNTEYASSYSRYNERYKKK